MFNLPSFGLGFVSGFGTGVFAREISRASATLLKPMVKSAIKTSLLMARQTRLTLAYAQETLEDLFAEAKDELGEEVAEPQAAGKHGKKERKHRDGEAEAVAVTH